MITPIIARMHEHHEKGTLLLVLVPIRNFLSDKEHYSTDGIYFKGELRLDDGRTITADQRRKAYATMADMSFYTGYLPEEIKELMKYDYIAATGAAYFSLSDCSVTTARLFINHLIEFSFMWDIPLSDLILARTDDISAALYACLMYKRCIICGGKGELHHEDAVGMGRKRKEIIHKGMKIISLCQKHHIEAHRIGKLTFNAKYHVYGLEADDRICEVWKLKKA